MHHGDHTAHHGECAWSDVDAYGWCGACHHSDSSTDGLTTNNQVQHTDCDADGIAVFHHHEPPGDAGGNGGGIGVNSLRLNGGRI